MRCTVPPFEFILVVVVVVVVLLLLLLLLPPPHQNRRHASDKPGFLAGHVVEVDTRFPRTKLSPQASNTVSTYSCYLVHKTIKQESIRQ